MTENESCNFVRTRNGYNVYKEISEPWLGYKFITKIASIRYSVKFDSYLIRQHPLSSLDAKTYQQIGVFTDKLNRGQVQ